MRTLKKQNIHPSLDEIFEQVRSLKLSSVIGQYISLKSSGYNKTGLCPFHNDKRKGSFSVSDSKELFKCFACGATGASIKFVQDYEGTTYKEAALRIAYKFQLITSDTYEYYSQNNNSKKIKKVKIIEKNEEKEIEYEKANLERRNQAYRLFIQACRLYHGKKLLVSEDSIYLRNERELDDYEIQTNGFFSFPVEKQTFLTFFKNYLALKNIKESLFYCVPGFFYNNQTKSIDYYHLSGIGIPVFDWNKNIEAIQVRKRTKKLEEKEQRYVWFSSQFLNKKGNKYGTSSGSPQNVIYPKIQENKTVFITEGILKAIKIAKVMKSAVISVQGVTTWKGIAENIKNIEKKLSENKAIQFKYVLVAFDADVNENAAVAQQLKLMTDTISENYQVIYLYWNPKYKGIDDYLAKNSIKNIHKVKKEIWDEYYEKIVKRPLEKTHNKNLLMIDKLIIKETFNEFIKKVINKPMY